MKSYLEMRYEKMKFLAFSIIFVIFYGIFDWVIKKTNFHLKLFDNKLLGKPRKYKFKFTRTVLILIIALFTFILELEKGSLNEKYGKFNYISIIIGAYILEYNPFCFLSY